MEEENREQGGGYNPSRSTVTKKLENISATFATTFQAI